MKYKNELKTWLNWALENIEKADKAETMSELVEALWSVKSDIGLAQQVYDNYAKEVLHNDEKAND